MTSINNWIGVGRLGHDPEVKKTQSGLSVCSFSIACDRRKTKEDQDPGTDWIDCVAWRGTADAIADHCSKGDLLTIEGHIQKRSYDGKDGKKVYVTEVVVDNAVFFGAGSQQTQSSGRTDYPSNGTSAYSKDIKAATPEEIAANWQQNGTYTDSDGLPF